MEASEIVGLLKAIGQTDSRAPYDDDRARAWAAILPRQIDYPTALQSVVEHYRISTEVMIPSHVVAYWKANRNWQATSEGRTGGKRIPMPDWFKAAIADARGAVVDVDGTVMGIGDVFKSAATLSTGETVHEPEDSHCRISACMCTHEDPCYRGWMDLVSSQTSPCPVCRPDLNRLLRDIPKPGERGEHDLYRLRNRAKAETYPQ